MIGETLKNYKIEEMLGKGGMGVVYRARDLKLNRPVALKVITPELCSDEERRRRFIHEARAASAVNHPAIAQIYEIEDTGDTTFIVMEYVEGSTVRQLSARRELDLSSVVEVAILVADGLARAHEAGIVHRDIKSDNIMVTRDGHPKILDFGLAKLLPTGLGPGDGSAPSRLETATLTQAGVIMGTISYMSPEQARGLPTDKRSDIFSFGIVLYEMVVGKLPFEGVSLLDTMHALAFEPAPPITTLRSDVPVPYQLQRVIDRCLQKKPESRYQDLRETVTELKAVKRQVDSGVSGGAPVLGGVRGYFRGLSSRSLSSRGLVWMAIWGSVFAFFALMILKSREASLMGFLMLAALGAWIYRRFRNRGQREVRRFVKKASVIREVKLVSFSSSQFTIITERPSAKTYLTLNALLATANERLYHGELMTMVVRENVAREEMTRILSSPGVQFVSDDAMRPSVAAAP